MILQASLFLVALLNFTRPIEIVESHSGLNGVDCIYVINLEERLERWERTKKCFESQGLHVNRVSAVNGWKLTPMQKAELAGPYPIRIPAGAIGCLLSHVSVYKDALEREWNRIWVVEDDVEFKEGVAQVSAVIDRLERIDPHWDVLYTDYKPHGIDAQDPRPYQRFYQPRWMQLNEDLMSIHGRHETHSMLISRNGLSKLLHYFARVHVWSPLDIDIHYVPTLREYCTTRDVVTEVSQSHSDTASSSELNVE